MGVTLNERQINHEFILNLPRYQGASILLTRDNFGCGSSREHAVWALLEYGFRVVIAPGFADIFFNNCFKNGLLPVVLDADKLDQLFELVDRNEGYSLTVNLAEQCLVLPSGESLDFDIDPMRKHKMLEGLDDIGLTLAHSEQIREFEHTYYQRRAWLAQ